MDTPVGIPPAQPALRCQAEHGGRKFPIRQRLAFPSNRPNMYDGRILPDGRDIFKTEIRGKMVNNLVAALRCINVFKGGAMFHRRIYQLDSVQSIQRHFPTPGSDYTHAQPEGARRKSSVGSRPPQARASGRQVTGDVADNQIVHRSEGSGVLHK